MVEEYTEPLWLHRSFYYLHHMTNYNQLKRCKKTFKVVGMYGSKSIPSGSATPAIWRASELAKSEFAGVTARIRQEGSLIYDMIIVLIRASISEGWSPTGTFVMPGRSTSVMSRTFGETIFKRICLSETPLLSPASLSVSAYRKIIMIYRSTLRYRGLS
jgi:hypothetical protein